MHLATFFFGGKKRKRRKSIHFVVVVAQRGHIQKEKNILSMLIRISGERDERDER